MVRCSKKVTNAVGLAWRFAKVYLSQHCISHQCIQSDKESSSELESENALSQSQSHLNLNSNLVEFGFS